ncbi:37S ribosomal protein S22 [Coemansia sp. Benny D115]|nr:37S ribosomal protein S22 [Coemansia sp. Benny D115]
MLSSSRRIAQRVLREQSLGITRRYLGISRQQRTGQILLENLQQKHQKQLDRPEHRTLHTDPTQKSDQQTAEPADSLEDDFDDMPHLKGYKSTGIQTRGTDETRYGEKYLGMSELPAYVTSVIVRTYESSNTRQLRKDYLRLADSLRSTGDVTPFGKGKGRAAARERVTGKSRDEEVAEAREEALAELEIYRALPGERIQISIPGKRPEPKSLVNPGTGLKPHVLEYGKNEALAYLITRAPATYGVQFNVLRELAARMPDGWVPREILDFGCGPAPGLWAAQEVWPKLPHYRGIDVSEDMLLLAEDVAASADPEKSATKIDFQRYLAPLPETQTPIDSRPDVVIAAFTLSDMPSDAVRQKIVDELWSHTSDVLVLIDRGSPDAARMISEARAQILAKEQDPAHTLAPLPNDLPDPSHNTPAWIHFSQRVQRPTCTMRLKDSKSNVEDLRYSYTIMRRGARPERPAKPFINSETVLATPKELRTNPELYLPNGMPRKPKDRLALESLYWPRIILPPIKRKGHVYMDVCTVEGNLERFVYTKAHSKQAYRDARKAHWGDLFPHTPKSTVARNYLVPQEPAEDSSPKRRTRADKKAAKKGNKKEEVDITD